MVKVLEQWISEYFLMSAKNSEPTAALLKEEGLFVEINAISILTAVA